MEYNAGNLNKATPSNAPSSSNAPVLMMNDVSLPTRASSSGDLTAATPTSGDGFCTPQTGTSPSSHSRKSIDAAASNNNNNFNVERVQSITKRMKRRSQHGGGAGGGVGSVGSGGLRRAATLDPPPSSSHHSKSSSAGSTLTADRDMTSKSPSHTTTPTRPRGKKNSTTVAGANQMSQLGHTRRRLSAHGNGPLPHAAVASAEQPSQAAEWRRTHTPTRLPPQQQQQQQQRYQRSRSGTGATPGIPAPAAFGRTRSTGAGGYARSRSGNNAIAGAGMTASQMYMQRQQAQAPPTTSSNTPSRNRSERKLLNRGMDRSVSPSSGMHRSPVGGRRITRELSRQELGYE